jgi:hypothetical protein
MTQQHADCYSPGNQRGHNRERADSNDSVAGL